MDSEETIAAHMARMKQAFFGGQTLVTLEAKIPGDGTTTPGRRT
ncbi:hypothetical protein [Arthrobacter woluwensis]|nr:hypothetical protein [Arthrobacter woluwensis]